MLGSYAALILKIPSQGVGILLVAVVASVFYDVGGFAIGRRFGRTPLTAVSPNKTVEGLGAGLLASVIGVLIFAVLLGFGPFGVGPGAAPGRGRGGGRGAGRSVPSRCSSATSASRTWAA